MRRLRRARRTLEIDEDGGPKALDQETNSTDILSPEQVKREIKIITCGQATCPRNRGHWRKASRTKPSSSPLDSVRRGHRQGRTRPLCRLLRRIWSGGLSSRIEGPTNGRLNAGPYSPHILKLPLCRSLHRAKEMLSALEILEFYGDAVPIIADVGKVYRHNEILQRK